MRFTSFFILAAFLAVQASAQGCDSNNVRVRKEWRDLTDNEKGAYLDASNCIRQLPSITSSQLDGKKSTNRFDDFQKLHIEKTAENNIHNVAQFLSWHRLFIWTYESTLINECGYNGALPYWNETKDAGQYDKSPLMDGSDLSFGSAVGTGEGNCVIDGAFKNATNHFGPGYSATDHCITRNVVNGMTDGTISSGMDLRQHVFEDCYSKSSYAEFWPCLENGPHNNGHNAMGGEMTGVYASPGDHLFYSHHAMIDFVWFWWQAQSTAVRVFDLSGPTLPGQGDQINMDYILDGHELWPATPIRDVLNPQGGTLCYMYQTSSGW